LNDFNILILINHLCRISATEAADIKKLMSSLKMASSWGQNMLEQ